MAFCVIHFPLPRHVDPESKQLRAHAVYLPTRWVVLLTAAGLLSGHHGLGSILVISIVSNICIHGGYSLLRTTHYFGLRFAKSHGNGYDRRLPSCLSHGGRCGAWLFSSGLVSCVYLALSSIGLVGLGLVLFLVWGFRTHQGNLAGTLLERFHEKCKFIIVHEHRRLSQYTQENHPWTRHQRNSKHPLCQIARESTLHVWP